MTACQKAGQAYYSPTGQPAAFMQVQNLTDAPFQRYFRIIKIPRYDVGLAACYIHNSRAIKREPCPFAADFDKMGETAGFNPIIIHMRIAIISNLSPIRFLLLRRLIVQSPFTSSSPVMSPIFPRGSQASAESALKGSGISSPRFFPRGLLRAQAFGKTRHEEDHRQGHHQLCGRHRQPQSIRAPRKRQQQDERAADDHSPGN